MAVILGISAGPHDSAACLLRAGQLLRAAAEERFTRRKQDGRFPEAAIRYCLDAEGLTSQDVDVVAHGWRFGAASADVLRVSQRVSEEQCAAGRAHMLGAAQKYEEVDRNVERRVYDGLARLGISRAKLRMYDHHLCHAAGALYFCPYPGVVELNDARTAPLVESACVTLDGRGDFAAGKVVVVAAAREATKPTRRKKNAGGQQAEQDPGLETGAKPERAEELQVLDATSMFDSIGFVWAFVTALLGFKPFRHEGKLTGLAARGDAGRTLSIFESAMALEQAPAGSARWQIRGRWRQDPADNFQLYMAGLEGLVDVPKLQDFSFSKALLQHSREDIAAGLQLFTERIMIDYLSRNGFVRPLLTLSGGVFANVRLNMRLRTDLPGVHQVFVCPSMGDGGLCLGAAALAAREHDEVVTAPRGLIGLGPSFTLAQIREALDASSVRPELIEEIQELGAFVRRVAELLHAGRVVGFFHGPMEFGPRALGHRSLLAPATDASINDTLNARLRRSEFMPFAPVTLRSHASEAYVDWDAEDLEAGRHMTMCYSATPAMQQLCPAVVHVDGTARPQVVDEREGLYHKVLEAYHSLSGIHTLVNTSFNRHEEPIICSPGEAVAAFEGGACDALGAYPFVVLAQSVGK